MKTSNKILVTAFVLALLILVSVHVSLYAKYKRGEFSVVPSEWQPNLATLSLDNIKYLSIDNIDNITVHLADSSKIAYEKLDNEKDSLLSFTRKNDTLYVSGKSTSGNIRRFTRTDLYIGQDMPLQFSKSAVHLSGKKGLLANRNLNFSLDSTSLDLSNLGTATAKLPFLSISARNKSSIVFGDAFINNLQLDLNNSSVSEEEQLIIDSLTIKTDPLSKISLRAQNLTKAKLTDL